MTCANAWPIGANGGDLSCYCPIIRLVKDWNEIVGSVMDWQIGDDLVDWSGIGAFLVFLNDGVLRPIVGLFSTSSLSYLYIVRMDWSSIGSH